MIRTAVEIHGIPMAAPRRDWLRRTGSFINQLCQDLNRYVDAAHKVHAAQALLDKPDRSLSREGPF